MAWMPYIGFERWGVRNEILMRRMLWRLLVVKVGQSAREWVAH